LARFSTGLNMTDNPAEIFVDEEVPQSIRRLIPSALRRAYAAADETIERHAYLATPGGKYQRGDLIMLAASYEFEQLVKTGSLPFDGSWEFFARPTGKHFVMFTERARITTSQVEDPEKKPRPAVHRENYGELNERSLLPEINEERQRILDALDKDQRRRLIHLLHGYHELTFAHITYPHPEENRHIFRSVNLMRLPHEISANPDLPPQEGPAESPNPEVVENIERHLRDEE
jgi:hypothetical protein